MKLGVFFLQNAQTAHGGVRLHTVRQEDLIRQKAFKHGRGGVFLRTESLPGIRVREARYGAHASRGDFLRKAEFPTGIDAELVGFFCPYVFARAAFKHHFNGQSAACDLQIRKPCALIIVCDFEDLRAESLRVFGHFGVHFKTV